MKFSNEQNAAFLNDPRRVEAQTRLDKIVKHIQADIRSDGSAQYYMSVLPRLLNELESAYENLSVVEAEVEAELLGKTKWHG